MRRLALFVPLALLFGACARDFPQHDVVRARRVLVAALPQSELERYLHGRGAALGLGVFPPTRRPKAFLEGMSRADPRAAVGTVPRLLRAAGVRIEHRTMFGAVPAFGSAWEVGSPRPGGARVLELLSASSADEIVPAPKTERVVLVGLAEETPLLVASLRGGPALLRSAVVGRPGIVTPHDLAATLLAWFGASVPESNLRPPLATESNPDPRGYVESLRARLIRDASYGPGLSRATAGTGMGAVLFGTLALRLRRRNVAAALARGAALAPAGYLAALFLPTSLWYVRGLAVAGAFLLGASFTGSNVRRFCGFALALTTAVVALLTVAAALNPGGEPALSLWGNPLNSWRFFGLRNHMASFLAGGVIVGTALVGASVTVLAVVAAATAIVIGAPQLGANFVGVPTVVFGAALALLGSAVGRLRFRHLAAAALVALVAFTAALLADAGSPVSHGGRAVESVRGEGVGAAWRFLRTRAELNYGEVASVGTIGFVGFVLAFAALVALLGWGWRSAGSRAAREPASGPLAERRATASAAVAGSAAAALVALFLEDSGFLSGSILGLYPWLGYVAVVLERERPGDRAVLP